MVKARRETAAATGHFQSQKYNVKLIKMVLKSTCHSFITLECHSDRLSAVKDLSLFNEREDDMK